MRAPNWIDQADQALVRAAARARALAVQTNTPLFIMENGVVVKIMPGDPRMFHEEDRVRPEVEAGIGEGSTSGE